MDRPDVGQSDITVFFDYFLVRFDRVCRARKAYANGFTDMKTRDICQGLTTGR